MAEKKQQQTNNKQKQTTTTKGKKVVPRIYIRAKSTELGGVQLKRFVNYAQFFF